MTAYKENRFIKRFIIIGLVIMALFMIVRVVFAVSPIIPLNRHFIYEGLSWYQKLFKETPEFYVVKSQISNAKDEIVEVKANAKIININKYGHVESTGQFLSVKPAIAKIYPKQLTNFKIYFPIKKNTSTLCLFTVRPVDSDLSQLEGIRVRQAGGFILGVTFGKFHPEETFFSVSREGSLIVATIENNNKTLIEGTLKLRGNNETARHFFLQAGKSREFRIKNDGFRDVLLDIGGMPRMLGVRLGK